MCVRQRSQIGAVIVSAIVGGVIGFLAWVAAFIAAFIYFAEIVSNQDEMGAAGDALPAPIAMVALIVWGTAAGAYFGWRLTLRRRTNEPPT